LRVSKPEALDQTTRSELLKLGEDLLNSRYRSVKSRPRLSDSSCVAAERLSVRCSSGTPPSRHNALCSPALKDSKLSLGQIDTDSQLEYVRTK